MAYSFQTATFEPQDNIMVIRTLLGSISRNNSSNLVISRRQVVTSKILILVSMKSDGNSVMLLFWPLSHDLKCLFVELDIRMSLIEDSLNDSHHNRI